jgi:hypothetical protein
MRFFVTPADDAYALEQILLHCASRNLSLKIDLKYRDGKFLVDAGDSEIVDDGEFCLAEFPDGQMCFVSDRFEATFDFLGGAIDEKEKSALIAGFHEDGVSHLEDHGWEIDWLASFIVGGIQVEECLSNQDC